MGRVKSDEGKLREGRGTGRGKDYKPWIKIRERNSIGTASSIPDWKHGRMVELLSQGEVWYYYYLRWRDDVEEIREQFPLDPVKTADVARSLGFRVPGGIMTTDLLVTMTDGRNIAISVKNSPRDLDKRRTLELQAIECAYWHTLGVPWSVVFKDRLNPVEIMNIRDVISCYDSARICDEFGLARHLIARKVITVDMTQEIDYVRLIESLKKEGIWKTSGLL